MKRLEVLAAALTWAVVLAAILVVTGPGGAVAGGIPGTWTIAPVAALAVALTLGLALSPLPLWASYVAAHLAGGVVVVAVAEGPRPPWAWHALPGLAALFARGTVSADRTTLALLTLALAWELAYACTWLVVRDRRVWLALGLIVCTLTLRGPRPLQGRETYLAALCLGGLVLALVAAALERRRALPRRLRSGLAMRCAPLLLLPLAGGLVAGAWAAPLPAARTVAMLRTGTWSRALDYLRRQATGDRRQEAGDGADALLSFGHSLPLGGAFRPDGTPVLDARIADPALSPYWRGAVYDRYAQGVWHTLPAHLVQEEARAPLPAPAGAATVTPITQVVSLLRPSTILVTAGLPRRLDVPALAALANGGVEAGVLSLAPLREPYTGTYAAASLPAPTAPISPAPVLSPELRALDLRLPPLPARLKALAHRLVANLSDPFSRAWAIQAYLRGPGGGYRYDTAPPPAAGQDPVDFFLFRSRRGFCTQFATAMVVLARLAGIPARLVTGFAAGHLVDGRFIVTTADAHAWPELWIAGRGWITFEPTPNFPTPLQANALVPTRTPGIAAPPPRVGNLGETPTVSATPTPSAQPTTTPTPSVLPTGTRTPALQPTTTRTPALQPSTTPPPAAQPSATPTAGHAPILPSPGGGPHIGWPRLHLPIAPSASAVLAAAMALLLSCAALLALRARAGVDALYARMCRLADLLHAGPRRGHTPLEWAAQVAARAPDDEALVRALTMLYVRQRYGGHPPPPAELAAARAAWRTLRRRWILRLLARRPL